MNRFWVSWLDEFDDESVALMGSAALFQFAVDTHSLLTRSEGIEQVSCSFDQSGGLDTSVVVTAPSQGQALDTAKSAVLAAVRSAGATVSPEDGEWLTKLLKRATVVELAPAAA